MRIRIPAISCVLFIIAAFCAVIVGTRVSASADDSLLLDELRVEVSEEVADDNEISEESILFEDDSLSVVTEQEEVISEEEYVPSEKLLSAHEQYEDIIGWVSVSDTYINYPVLDGAEYLNLNVAGEDSVTGSICCDKVNDKTYVYGHHMAATYEKTGMGMFRLLDLYDGSAFESIEIEMLDDGTYTLVPFLSVSGRDDGAVYAIETADDLADFCEGKRITFGQIPEELESDYFVFLTCNYSEGKNCRTYLFCSKAE